MALAAGLVAVLAAGGDLPPAVPAAFGGALVGLLTIGLVVGSVGCLAAAVAGLGVVCVGANGDASSVAVAEAAVLVLVAELAWWSLELRPGLPSTPATLARRWLVIGALVCGAVSAAAWVTVVGQVETAGIVGPVVGAAGAIALVALGWGLDRSRYD